MLISTTKLWVLGDQVVLVSLLAVQSPTCLPTVPRSPVLPYTNIYSDLSSFFFHYTLVSVEADTTQLVRQAHVKLIVIKNCSYIVSAPPPTRPPAIGPPPATGYPRKSLFTDFCVHLVVIDRISTLSTSIFLLMEIIGITVGYAPLISVTVLSMTISIEANFCAITDQSFLEGFLKFPRETLVQVHLHHPL